MLRRYTFKLYPNAAQAAALEHQRRLHSALYNALIQQRIEAYSRVRFYDEKRGRMTGKTLGYYDQCKELTALRAADPEYDALSSDSMAATAQRVDRAFKAFFKRAKAGAGAASGFPRYKRVEGLGFKKHGSGWKLDLRPDGARPGNGRMYIMGVPGRVKVRGRLPRIPEEFRTCELMQRAGDWWLSLVVEMPEVARAKAPDAATLHFNLVDSFATVRVENGGRAAGPDDVTVFVAADGRIRPHIKGLDEDRSGPASDCGLTVGVVENTTLTVQSGPASDCGLTVGSGCCRTTRPASGPASDCALTTGCGSGSGSGEMSGSPPDTNEFGGRAAGLTGQPEGRISNPNQRGIDASGSDPGDLGTDRGDTLRAQRRPSGSDPGDLSAAMARCKRGSHRYRALRLRKARIQARQARQRRESLHEWTTMLARRMGTLTIIKPPSMKAATKSGRGDERQWGAAVETKAALNRHVLDMAPALAIQMLEYKIAERGGSVTLIDDPTPPVDAGEKIVAIAKASRRIRATLRKERKHAA